MRGNVRALDANIKALGVAGGVALAAASAGFLFYKRDRSFVDSLPMAAGAAVCYSDGFDLFMSTV